MVSPNRKVGMGHTHHLGGGFSMNNLQTEMAIETNRNEMSIASAKNLSGYHFEYRQPSQQ
jgi:hypothetical protein